MFIGHYAVALGAKPWAPRVSLGILFLACQLADLIWPNLVLLGIERFTIEPGITAITPFNFIHYPYSHSLVALVVWAALFALLYRALAHSSGRAAVIVAAVVLSHWVLDVVSHRPDMPIIVSDTTRVGLGLWDHPLAAVMVELGLFAAGVYLFVRSTKPIDRQGSIGFWALVVFLLGIYAANLAAAQPPPSVAAVAWSAQALWLFVAWGYWVDRHRVAAR